MWMTHPLPAGDDLRLAGQQADGQDERHRHRILQAWAQPVTGADIVDARLISF
jgi:hypothetical protein